MQEMYIVNDSTQHNLITDWNKPANEIILIFN